MFHFAKNRWNTEGDIYFWAIKVFRTMKSDFILIKFDF